jgi:hypothetical protein
VRLFNIGVISLALVCGTQGADTVPTIQWVKDSTVPLVQLTGETTQFYRDGTLHKIETPTRTLTNCNLAGTDLGVPVTFSDKIVFVFGDSWPYVRKDDGKYYWHKGWGKVDSIGYIPLPFDFSACRALEDLDAKIAKGVSPLTPDYSTAPLLQFFIKPKATAGQPSFDELNIKKLAPKQGLGPYEVPTGAFALNGYLYMFYNVKHQEQMGKSGKKITFFLNSILARSDQTHEHWKKDVPPTFTRLFDVSEQPGVADPENPPEQETGPGKFIHAAPAIMDQAMLNAAGLSALLPADLQNADKVILIWGASWRYPHSNLYLAAISAADIEAQKDGTRDISKWWYFGGIKNGKAEWNHDELGSAPLLDSWLNGKPCIGEHSVIWNDHLKQFILAYQDRWKEIIFRTSPSPWGPWSREMRVFGHGDVWAKKILHHMNQDTISNNVVQVYKQDGKEFTLPVNWGATYGPYMLDQCTNNADGSLTVYFTMSTWTPYNVFLMKTSFRPVETAK